MVTCVFPAICAPDVQETADFYRELFGFVDVFASDWYVQLEFPGHAETQIGIVAFDHPTVPEGHRTLPTGVLISIEVDDVDAVHTEVRARNLPDLRSLRSEAFGQRHFITQDPAGTMVDVITPIPITDEDVVAGLAPGAEVPAATAPTANTIGGGAA